MANRSRAQRDGVTIAPGHRPGKARLWLAGAAVLLGVGAFVLFRPSTPPDQLATPAPPAVAAPSATAPRVPGAPPPQRPVASDAAQPAPEPAAQPSDVQTPADADEQAPIVPSGIGLFPPRGTDPVRVGIVVPDDFELPEGFVRHYQVTDDGQELAPILLVHPDYELLDAAGNPVARPEGGVVPPELAPPGMPIEIVELPEPLDESAP